MGLFRKEECAICNKEVGLNRIHIANKECICGECFKKAGFDISTPIKSMTIEDVKAAMIAYEANTKEFSTFNATKKVGTFLQIDDNKKQWLIPVGKNKIPRVYNYADIIDYELLEDGDTITKGGLGSAVAGGILFGGVGAIVGGATGKRKNKAVCNSLKIKITVKDISNPVVYITFINSETKKNGFIYKTIYNSAQECLSLLQLICDSQGTSYQNNDVTVASGADEILKYKNLLDSGIITQEEFEAKKKQLLGL